MAQRMLTRFLRSPLIGIILAIQCSRFLSYHALPQSCILSSLKGAGNDNQYPKSVSSSHDSKALIDSMKKLTLSALGAYSIFGSRSNSAAFAASFDAPPTPNKGFQTKSGLKYFDFVEGTTGKSPKYGQLVSFHYIGYYRATPQSKLDVFDSVFSPASKESFLHKHGNGRVIRGIDEGLHTMKVGGKRRVIIPKNIGYDKFGMGPVPTEPKDRRKLGKLLDLLEVDKGELLFDLELVLVADDENDQGYYEDEPVTQDEVRKLVLKSMDTEINNGPLMDKMIQTTPNTLFQK